MNLEKRSSFVRSAVFSVGLSTLVILGACTSKLDDGNIPVLSPAFQLFEAVANVALVPLILPYNIVLGDDEGEVTLIKNECVKREGDKYCEFLITHKAPWDIFDSTSYDIITISGQREYKGTGAERNTGDLEIRREKIFTLYFARDIGARNMEGEVVELFVYEGKIFDDLKIDFINPKDLKIDFINPKFSKAEWTRFRKGIENLNLSRDFLGYRRFFSKGVDRIVEGYGEGARQPLDEVLWLFEKAGLNFEKVLE